MGQPLGPLPKEQEMPERGTTTTTPEPTGTLSSDWAPGSRGLNLSPARTSSRLKRKRLTLSAVYLCSYLSLDLCTAFEGLCKPVPLRRPPAPLLVRSGICTTPP